MDKMLGVAHVNTQIISRYTKAARFSLYVYDFWSKYSWVIVSFNTCIKFG